VVSQTECDKQQENQEMMRKIRGLLLAGALAVGLIGYQASPASAAIDTDLVLAAVTGYTTASADPFDPTFQGAEGTFKGFEMAGAFVACELPTCDVYAGSVTVTDVDGVNFDTTQNLLVGAGSLAINGAETIFGDDDGFLTGTLDDGSFVRVGTVAIAEFNLTYDVDGLSGEVAAVAAIIAVPGAVPSEVSNGACPPLGEDVPPTCTLVSGLVAGGVDPVLANDATDSTRPGDIVQGVLDLL